MSPALIRKISPGTTASTATERKAAVSLDLCLECHRSAQDFRRFDGMPLLNCIQPYGEGEDRHDDRTTDGVAGDGRDDTGCQ